MTARELAIVSLKVLGIFWILTSVLMIPNLLLLGSVSMASHEGAAVRPSSMFMTQLFGAVLVLAVGVALLVGTRGVLKLLFRETSEGGAPLNSVSFQAVALSILGAWLALSALSSLAASATFYLTLSNFGNDALRSEYSIRGWEVGIEAVFQIFIGLGLFVGARAVANSWHRGRRSVGNR